MDWVVAILGKHVEETLETALERPTRVVAEAVERLGLKGPGPEGAFGKPVSIEQLVSAVGTELELNAEITARVLLAREHR